jgi:hypothetical protein
VTACHVATFSIGSRTSTWNDQFKTKCWTFLGIIPLEAKGYPGNIFFFFFKFQLNSFVDLMQLFFPGWPYCFGG